MNMKQATTDELLNALVYLALHGTPCGDTDDHQGTSHTPCHGCEHVRAHPYDAHVLCAKPTPTRGHPHGIQKGWFMYPLNFDPTWRTHECPNFIPITVSVKQSVSQSAHQ